MTTSCTDNKHPYYEGVIKSHSSKGAANFFTGENSFRMRFVSLGEVLDFVSAGGLNYVAYEMNTKNLISFIRTWMKNQEPRRYYKRVPSETKGCYTLELIKTEWKYRWNNCRDEEKVSLPRIEYDSCPQMKGHRGAIRDLGGRIRCAQMDKKVLKPNYTIEREYLDKFSGLMRKDFWEEPPHDPTPAESIGDEEDEGDYSEEYNQYLLETKKFDEEEATLLVNDVCYAIIKESSNVSLSLETILDRLNCSQDNFTTHPFSGFTLANYVKSWWEQPGRKRLFRKKGEGNYYKEFKNFVPMSSED